MVQYEINIPHELIEVDTYTGHCTLQERAARWCQRMCLGNVNLIAMTNDLVEGESLWDSLKSADFSLLFDNPRDAAFFKLNFLPVDIANS